MSSVLIGMVGDVLVNRDDPMEVFSEVRDILKAPDVLFANLECAYTDNPRPVPSAPVIVTAPAHNLDVFAQVGFNVMSMANNHIVDGGHEAMLETRARLKLQGVRTCGAGISAVEAHEPAIVDAQGLRVGFLAYCCAFPNGYEARSKMPGLAPMRAYRYWRDADPTEVSGLPELITLPDQNDLAALTKDIERARESADLVVTSFHWGDYTRRFHLTEHEKRTARYCIDQGADMVIGHHHHVLRGIEWYKGKPIFYGLGHFAFELRWEWSEDLLAVIAAYEQASDACYTIAPREGWPLLPMHEDARMTMLAWARAGRAGISEVGFLPCRLTPDGRVRPLDLTSRESAEVIAYLNQCNSTQGIKSVIVPTDTVVLSGFKTLAVVPA